MIGMKSLPQSVKKALLDHPIGPFGPIDANKIIQQLTEDEQCYFFSQFPQCQSIVLTNWSVDQLAMKVLRCVSIVMGDKLIEVDLSHSHVDSNHFQVLLARAQQIRSLTLSHCPRVDGQCMNILAKLAHKSMRDLFVDNCPLFKLEPLQWLAGTIGFRSPRLKKLELLDLSGSPVVDDGLIAVSIGCHNILYLNLFNCIYITDTSVCKIAEKCTRMKYFNLSGCTKITNKTVVAIGRHCPDVVTINLSRCSAFTDVGIISLSKGCTKLQALNLAGIPLLTERSLLSLAENCRGLLMLNLTGCQQITTSGIAAMIAGLEYVEMAITYVGFKPIDKHVEKKLADQLMLIKQIADDIRRNKRRLRQEQIEEMQINRYLLEDSSARCIQGSIYRYACRMRFYNIYMSKLRQYSAGNIQRIFRGGMGRMIARNKREELIAFQAKAKYAIIIQKFLRGLKVRKENLKVAKAIRRFHLRKENEIHNQSAVTIQSYCRRYLSIHQMKAYRELNNRRKLAQDHAIRLIQRIGLIYVARVRIKRMRYERMRREDIYKRAGAIIWKWYKYQKDRYFNKMYGKEIQELMRKQKNATLLLQRVYRGHVGREAVRRILIRHAVYHKAAIMIQRIYRGNRVLHWRDIKLNVIAAFVLDRHYIERQDSVVAARLRYQKYLEENRNDSGSEPDYDDEEIEWIYAYDNNKRRDYWYNHVNNDILYYEPRKSFAHEKAMIGKQVRIFWIVQKNWYEGTITRFRKRNHRHRVEYMDHDKEWINLEEEHERVQVQLDDGSWVMYKLYETDALKYDHKVIDENDRREEYKKQAFNDALQWKLIQNDYNYDVMYISNKTGEIRKGVPTANDWVVQDDGYGYPCFYNVQTGAIEHNDPRFIFNVDDDLQAQRNYVMQELRYNLYFCNEFYERYNRAIALGDTKEQRLVLLQVCKSLKPKHLTSFLIRASSLFQVTSVVDKPMYEDVFKELEYAKYLSSQLSDMIIKGEKIKESKKDEKRRGNELADQLKPVASVMYCKNCKKETMKHLDLCPHCGYRQIGFY